MMEMRNENVDGEGDEEDEARFTKMRMKRMSELVIFTELKLHCS